MYGKFGEIEELCSLIEIEVMQFTIYGKFGEVVELCSLIKIGVMQFKRGMENLVNKLSVKNKFFLSKLCIKIFVKH